MSDNKSAMSHVRHEFLDDLAKQVEMVLIDLNISKDAAEQCGIDVSNHLATHWGGQNFSFPKDYVYKLSVRDLAIYNEANRDNVHQLARKHGITVNAVYRALKRIRPIALSKKQHDMFI